MRCLLRRYSFSPLRNSRRPSSRTWKSTGSSPSPLSRTSVTSAMPWAERFSEPAQMTSSALRDRSARPCSPSAQRSASARFDLPEPFGPTTALMPAPNSTLVRSANDLKPWRRSASRRGRHGPGQARASAGAGRRSRLDAVRHTVTGSSRADRARVACGYARSPAAAAAVSASAATAPRRPRAPRRPPRPRSGTTSRGPAPWPRGAGIRGASPVRRCVYSWSRLLGLLSARDRRLQRQLRRRPASISQSRTSSKPRSRYSAPVSASNDEASSDGRRRPLRCDSPSPSSRSARGRCGRRGGRGRSVETMAARRADRAPSSSSGWRA